MAKVLVCNALNTSDYDVIDGKDCITYWREKKHRLKVTWCRACHNPNSDEDAIVGGHVMTVFGTPHIYITPIHDSCNKLQKKLDAFPVDESDLVPVPKDQETAILNDPVNVEERARQKAENVRYE